MNCITPRADVPLATLLRMAADELRTQPAPPMRAAVLAALPVAAAESADAAARAWRMLPALRLWPRRDPHNGAARRFALPALATAGVAFALLVVAGSVLLMLAPPQGAGHGEDLRLAASGFVPVVGPEQWLRLRDDGGTAWVVNTEMPRARLGDYGLPFDAAHAADPVHAELLMRASGEVLAVRVLY